VVQNVTGDGCPRLNATWSTVATQRANQAWSPDSSAASTRSQHSCGPGRHLGRITRRGCGHRLVEPGEPGPEVGPHDQREAQPRQRQQLEIGIREGAATAPST